MVRVWKVPFGYLIQVKRPKDRWWGFKATDDVRRVYETLARRGVPRKMTCAALVKANPEQARLHKLDR